MALAADVDVGVVLRGEVGPGVVGEDVGGGQRVAQLVRVKDAGENIGVFVGGVLVVADDAVDRRVGGLKTGGPGDVGPSIARVGIVGSDHGQPHRSRMAASA